MYTRLDLAKIFKSGSIATFLQVLKFAVVVLVERMLIGIDLIKQSPDLDPPCKKTTLKNNFIGFRRLQLSFLVVTILIFSSASLLPLHQAFAQTSNAERALFLGDRNYPPYEFIQNGTPKGLAVDILYAVTREAEVDAELKLMQWSKAQELVQAGQADGHSIMTPTPSREKNYHFSRPILDIAYVLFVSARDKDKVHVADLPGLKIGVTKGGLPFQYLSEFHPEADLVIVRNDVESIGKLLKGELDAMSTNQLTGMYLIKKHGVTGITPVSWSLVEKEMRMAIRKDNPALLDKLNAAIDSLQKKGALTAIKDKWMSSYQSSCVSNTLLCYLLLGTGTAVFLGLLYFLITRPGDRRKGDK